jgi:alginate O-acetyltransferase complex protein AlgJ
MAVVELLMNTRLPRRCVVQTALFIGIIAVMGIIAALNVRTFSVPQPVELVDGSLAKAFETHYDELFPAKKLGVNLWAAIDYAMFGEGRPGVVLGKQDWLYTDEEFDVAENYEENIRSHLLLIGRLNRRLASEGVSLVVSVVPTKARIYPEFLAGRKPARAYGNLYDEVLAGLHAEAIPAVDLRGALAAGPAQQPTYFRTDTHWTPWGAKLAAAQIARTLRDADLLRSPGGVYATRTEEVRPFRGDLFSFLPLDPYFARLLPPQENIDVVKTEAFADGDRSSTAEQDLFGDSELPDVVLVGTSYSANPSWNFAGFLQEYLGEDIVNYAREGAGPFRPMADYLRSEDFRRRPPRMVIWEIPERSLMAKPEPDTGS